MITCDTSIPEAQVLNTVCLGRNAPSPYCAYEAPALNSIRKNPGDNLKQEEKDEEFKKLKELFDEVLPF